MKIMTILFFALLAGAAHADSLEDARAELATAQAELDEVRAVLITAARVVKEAEAKVAAAKVKIASLTGVVVFHDDFEEANLRPIWNRHGNRADVTDKQARSGRQSLWTQVNPGQGRTEVQTSSEELSLRAGKTYCVKVSVRPELCTTKPSWGPSLVQFHATPGSGLDWSKPTGRNPITVMIRDGVLALHALNPSVGKPSGQAYPAKTITIPVGDPLGKWTDLTFKFRMSTGNDGLLVAYANGTEYYSRTGPNMDSQDSGGRPAGQTTIMKLGLYLSGADRGTHKAYYDDVSVVETESCP